jgi:N6-L-threonylcarbamoyladenine synthase
MKILSIETSCDETAISIVEARGDIHNPSFTVCGNALYSQIELHREFGGVFPMLAKREHGKNFTPLLLQTLTEAQMNTKADTEYSTETWDIMRLILEKEEGVYDIFRTGLEHLARPNIDVITVTAGPGLEPALWVGISCARALGALWGVPVIPVNHMEGHIASVLIENNHSQEKDTDLKLGHIEFPALALLISGGHTELVSMKEWGSYTVIGQTQDDAVGEAFDKVARLLGLPYPGGPEISKLAEKARQEHTVHRAQFPRPMITSNNLHFSFSGLKTSVLYYLRDTFDGGKTLTEQDRMDIAREFEDSVVDVLLTKTKSALDTTGARTLVIAGGVIANKKIRETFQSLESEYADLKVRTPERSLATDNALMIACAGYINILLKPDLLTNPPQNIKAEGNLHLG